MESKDSDSANKIDTIKDYLYRHPSTSIIDPFEAVRAVVSRARTCRRLRELEDDFGRSHAGRKRCPFRQPRFAVSESPELLGEAVQCAGLSFPVICKPIEACGRPLSHSMVVAVDAEGLSLVECPSVVQEYINHSGLFFKVYVIDQDVMVFQRPSLPDLVAEPSGDAASSSVRSVVFDSRFAYPTLEDFYFSGGAVLCSDGEQSASSEASGSVALDTRHRQHRRRKPRNEDLAALSAHKHHHASGGNKHNKKHCRHSTLYVLKLYYVYQHCVLIITVQRKTTAGSLSRAVLMVTNKLALNTKLFICLISVSIPLLSSCLQLNLSKSLRLSRRASVCHCTALMSSFRVALSRRASRRTPRFQIIQLQPSTMGSF